MFRSVDAVRLLRLQYLHRCGAGRSARGQQSRYISSAITELDLAAGALGPKVPPVSTIFVGGGTPTLLPPDELGRFVQAVADRFGLAPDAEITTESNPESVDAVLAGSAG